ncbi:ATP-dependent RNA helicase DHX30-like [Plodia interpunctella]|uniref:ATP-dependent RNA helicase DHX30-like n=1 Tax=Plodia interpunctella TaxID=58824 RepID=UPI002368D57E|nr:ATP-dependent RNA helicase DHX30-like [Plodia interpunctella]
MLLRRCLLGQTQFWRKYLKTDIRTTKILSWNSHIATGCYLPQRHHSFNLLRRSDSYLKTSFIHPLHRQKYSKGLFDGDVLMIIDKIQEQDLKKITELFPQPRVTLNELTAKTPQKIFDIHFRQLSSAPKGVKKAKKVQNDWVATYTFIWPEKMKFECTSKSKRQAAEKSAIQALIWLYKNNRINDKGSPIYDQNVLEEIRSTLKEPIHVSISDSTMERIDRIWDDYQNGIKNIYDAAAEKASHFVARSPAALTKDSTIDEDPEYIKEESGSEEVADISDLKIPIHPVYGRHINPPSDSTLMRRNRLLKQRFQDYDEELTPLPIDDYTAQITSTIDNSRVTVIVGAAGCGKSTRVPAAILRHCGAQTAMVVTEPRRVAAIGLADRVASEMAEEVGESIGYQVRLQAKPPRPPAGSVLYCTSGVLLRRLQTNPGLKGCSHVVIDEAHERDVNTDITLLLLKRALNINPELKVIIMSATLDTQVFTRYFESCPVIEVPGRTFPVEISYLDDIQKKYNLSLSNCFENCTKEDARPNLHCEEIAEVIKAVDKNEQEGAILVFLPGWAEIRSTKQILDQCYRESNVHLILPVHSRLSTTEQTKMFSKPPPGVRKIVLATNVAETSITIPDVVYVIDSGAHKENKIKEATGTASLETVWVSAAGAKQRAGRAGRVQPGHCYRLYTKEKESEFIPHNTPEILRMPLEQTVLDCKTYAPDDKVQSFFSELPEPPSEKAIHFAVNDLIDLGALTASEKLTKLGSILSSLSLHPRAGRSVLTAAVGGGVSTAAVVAAHCQDYVELFVNAADRREEIREIKRKYSDSSDHCALNWIQHEFEEILNEKGRQGVDKWCEKYGLRRDRLTHVKSLSNLYLEQLVKSGFLGPSPDAEELNRFSDIDELTSAILLSGSNSLLVTRKHVKTKGKLKTKVEVFTSKGDRAHVGTESVNYGITKRVNKTQFLTYFGGFHSMERRALVVNKTSLIPPHTALLFCRGDLQKITSVEEDENITILSLPRHRLQVHILDSQADHIMKTKEMLWSTIQYYIDRNTNNLNYEETTKVTRFKVRLFKAIGRMLVEANKDYVQRDVEDIR